MTVRPRLRHTRRALLTLAAAATLALGGLLAGGTGTTARAATQEPCDIYAAGGTPCVAAHSTTRALYAAYSGPLYQVRRSSDNATTNISPLSAGGVANAATQDSFCAGTSCVITEIYDQSGNGNNLTDAPGGGAAGGPDGLANATAAPATVGGHEAYGVFIAPGDGYRDDNTRNVATGTAAESEYAIFDGTHFNGGCCFDYGNAETNNNDDGAGTMEAIYFGNIKVWGFGSGNGPWIMADMENGLYSGSNAGLNSGDPTTNFRFTTAMVEGNSTNQWAILGGNAQSGGLSTDFSGTRPSGYFPMKKQGAIILGIGGDNSKGADGTFYEGVMTTGYASSSTEAAVQANIVAAGYNTGGGGGGGGGGTGTGPIVSGVSSSVCMDNNNGSGANGNKVQVWACDGYAPAQSWTVNSNGTITIDGGCLDITGANYNNGTPVQLYSCWGGANQQWKAQNGELVNPASGKCLDDPNGSTTNGTQLQIYTCWGGSNQKWSIP
jgi:non-reducing end alpha-L-arabinofuranosidase